MKKIYLLIIVLVMLLLTGCGKNKILDIKVEDINACIDNFDINAYSFKVIYEDREENVYMVLDYFSEEDQNKLSEKGEHVVTLVYEGYEKTFNIILDDYKAIAIIANPSIVNSYVNEFKYEMVNLEVLYNDGSTEIIELSKSHLSKEDVYALSKGGTYDVVVTYEDLTTTIHFELLPNETPISELKQDVVVYCLTTKIGDKFHSTFYALGNKEFSGLQFRILINENVNELSIEKVSEKLVYDLQEDSISFIYASPENNTGNIELFTIVYNSNIQYKNFNVDYDFDVKIVYIKNNEVLEIESNIFTFTR